MTKETDRIDVTFDNNTGVPFYFSITNEEEIKQIIHIIFTGVLKKQSKEINDGNHTSIKIIQGEKTYSIAFLVACPYLVKGIAALIAG